MALVVLSVVIFYVLLNVGYHSLVKTEMLKSYCPRHDKQQNHTDHDHPVCSNFLANRFSKHVSLAFEQLSQYTKWSEWKVIDY
jgi:hypothetical protein